MSERPRGEPGVAPVGGEGVAALRPRPAAPVGRLEVERARRKVVVPPSGAASRRVRAWGLAALDLLVVWGSLAALPFVVWEPPREPLVGWILALTAAVAIFVAGGYRAEARGATRAAALGGLAGLSGAWLILKALSAKLSLKLLTPPAAPGMVGAALVIAVWLVGSRALARRRARRTEARAALLFIGGRADAADLRERLAQQGRAHPFVHLDPELTAADAAGGANLEARPLSELDAHAQGAVKAIVLGVSPEELPATAVADLFHCRVLNVPVLSPSQLVEDLQERTPVRAGDHGWYLFDGRLHAGGSVVYQGLKRASDAAVATIALLALAPLLAVTAIAVAATSRGPVLYRQRRVGQWKRPFTILKFRTMRVDAERGGARWTSARDPRVTPIGRLLRRSRLDELPQLWNVLVGHMALVGPRPERPEFTVELERRIPYYDLRHLVRPGITGWAQVSAGYAATFEDAVVKLEYDIYYVKHASFAFDVRILLRTVGVIARLSGR